MSDQELAAAKDALDRTLREVRVWLVAAALYLESRSRGGDELARIISERLDAALDEMTVEGISARTTLEGRENRL